jgi:hypothetical protein
MSRAVSLFLLFLILLGWIAAPPAAGAKIGEHLQAILQDLGPEEVPSGILYDRVLSLSHAEFYDGARSARPASLGEWRQAFSEMRRASVTPPPWPAPDALAARNRAMAAKGAVPIAIMNFRYERIRQDALDTGALVERAGRLVAGKGQALVSSRLFAAAPMEAHTYRGGEVSFSLEREDYFTNDPSEVRGLDIDFDDGAGFTAMALGSRRAVHYAETGRKTIRLRLTLTNGAELYGASYFDVLALRTPAPNDTLHVTAAIPYLGAQGAGDAYLYLADGHSALTNPVVVLEGFDPGNTMNWDELYNLLNREMLLETLRGDGYDAVVFNYTDGGDYIQRNAFAAVELLQEVRAAIGPDGTMAMIGASMGGLVGRYALTYMETQGLTHGVRTFISFDSPQTGANIPLGMQYWLAFFSDQSADAAAFLAQLDTPAARQLLVYHHTDPPGTSGQSDPLRATLLSELASMGQYPTLPRIVAVANGSAERANQGFQAGDQIIRWEYTSILVDITGDIWSVPDGGSRTIFHGLIDYIFLPADQLYVTVSGTHPYDNAPGGWRDSMGQLAATDPGYGDIVALYPNHCFIPTISSLALDTDNLFYDIAGDPALLSHTQFDAVYYPAENQEHVAVTPENAPWILAEIEAGSSAAGELAAGGGQAPRIVSVSPNPLTTSSQIRLSLPAAAAVRLEAFAVGGRRVGLLLDGTLPAGPRSIRWDAREASGAHLPAGVYYLRLTAGGQASEWSVVTLR